MAVPLVSVDSCRAQNDDPSDPMTLTDNIPSSEKGKTELVLEHIEKDSLYAKIGLKEGDVIKEWNGKKTIKRSDCALIDKSTKNSKEFTVVIERDGKDKILHYVKK